jgi:hypothetical protein
MECLQKKKTKVISRLDVRLCVDCTKLNKYILIAETKAIKEYYLEKDALDNFPYFTKHVYRNLCYLYRLSDVMTAFCTRYQLDPNNNLAIQAKLDELRAPELLKQQAKRQAEEAARQQAEEYRRAIDERRRQEEQEREPRKIELVAALEKNGLVLRYDSKLCLGYINGTIGNEWTIPKIVQRMCQVKYLFDYCNMKRYLDREHANRRYREYSDSDDDYYRQSPFEVAEGRALASRYGKFPDQWPWLKDTV